MVENDRRPHRVGFRRPGPTVDSPAEGDRCPQPWAVKGLAGLRTSGEGLCPRQGTKGFFEETVRPHPGFLEPVGSQTAGATVDAHSTTSPTVWGPNRAGC